jgi:hypothetical protein
MRYYRDRNGAQQLYLTDAEIDQIAEDELRKAGLLPRVDSCRVDIEGLIERHLGAHLDVGATLDADILGTTEFWKGEPPVILINRELTDAAFEVDEFSGTLGRWRATLAHEATHVILHPLLFELNAAQESMFAPAERSEGEIVRCFKRDSSFAGRTNDPREYQANKGMAGLLMPRSVFGQVARDVLPALKLVPAVVEHLARQFEVSRQATRIRLASLGFTSPAGELVAGLFS